MRGNHDKWFFENQLRDLPEATLSGYISQESVDFLGNLPVTREFQTLMAALPLCHGLGKNDMARLTPADYGYAIESNLELQELIYSQRYKFIINGHTHRRMVRSFAGLTIINVGTLKREYDPCFAVADLDKSIVQFYNFDSASEIYDGEEYQLQFL